MKKTLLLVLALGFGACSRQSEAPPPAAPPAAEIPASAQPPAQSASPDGRLSPDLYARLVRDHSPVLGPSIAPVTIVEFLDPACEACRAFAPVVKQIQFMHPREVRVVVRYAAFHRGSDEAVRLLDAARRQGRFEPALNALFDGQSEWASHHSPNLERAWQLVAAAGIDIRRARRDAQSAQASDVLKQDGEDVVALKVHQTPTFFVNGRPLATFGDQQLLELVSQEVALAQAGRRTP
jgi:protein-disulfide isomerase